MAYDRDYPDSYDNEYKCLNCGCTFDQRYFDECPNCFLSTETVDPDEWHDSKIDRE